MDYVIRAVRAGEWASAREIRLAALQDPAAPVAFLETYETALGRPDAFWQERTAGAAEGTGGRQFIAETPEATEASETPGGTWVGTVSVLIERPGGDTRFGAAAEVNQAHLVGVFVRPEARGSGVTEALFRAAVDWARSLSDPRIERIRLYVHENNPRAAAFYRRFGFEPSGQTASLPGDPSARELEYVLPTFR